MARTAMIRDFESFSGDLLPEASGSVFEGYDRKKKRPTWLVVNDTSPETALFLVRQDGKKLKAKRLKLPPGSPSLDDLEGVTRIGNTFYAIGSYAGDKRSQKLVKIELADDFSVRKITAAPKSAELKDAIQALLEKRYPRAFSARDFEKGRFNIEGLTATEEGTLLIGLRGPLLQQGGKKKALVIELKNPDAAFSPDPRRALDLSVHQLLDMQGAGIRALSGRVPGYDGEGLLAIAGKSVVGREAFSCGKGRTAKFLLYFVDAGRNLCRRIGCFPKMIEGVKTQPEVSVFGFSKKGKPLLLLLSDDGNSNPKHPLRQGRAARLSGKKLDALLGHAGIAPAPGA